MTKMGSRRTAPKKPIKKKPPKDWLLDELVRQYIRLISRGYCERCKKYVGVENIEAAHMYGRKRKTVKWDLRNVYPLCKNNVKTNKKGCHEIVDNDAIAKASFMYDVMSTKDVADLAHIASKTIKQYPIDREAIKKDLEKKLKGL